MPAMVGHIRIVNIGSSGIFILEMYLRLGLLVIHALSRGRLFNVGDNVSVYNYQSATTVNDSDVVASSDNWFNLKGAIVLNFT